MEQPGACRLLSIVWYRIFPAKMGGQKGIAHFNEALAKEAGLFCLCARSNNTGETHSYKVLPELPTGKLQFINPFTWKRIFKRVKEIKPSHLLIEHPYYGFMAVRAKKKFGIPFIVHEHNLEWQRFSSMKRLGWRLLKAYEGFVLRRAALVLFKTEEDRQAAILHHRLQAERTFTVPYGTWLQERPVHTVDNNQWLHVRYPIPHNHLILYFNGTFDYTPNSEALEHISNHIFPLLEKEGIAFTLLLTGKNLPEGFMERNDRYSVIYTELADDPGEYYTGCDVFINPVLSGGGVRTKLVEALAHNARCVSTQTGAAGIPPVLGGKNLYVCPDGNWKAFTHAIITAANAPKETPVEFYETLHWPRIARETVAKINSTAGK